MLDKRTRLRFYANDAQLLNRFNALGTTQAIVLYSRPYVSTPSDVHLHALCPRYTSRQALHMHVFFCFFLFINSWGILIAAQ